MFGKKKISKMVFGGAGEMYVLNYNSKCELSFVSGRIIIIIGHYLSRSLEIILVNKAISGLIIVLNSSKKLVINIFKSGL